jgi:hypothetical protein
MSSKLYIAAGDATTHRFTAYYVSLTIACYDGTQVPLQRPIENSFRRAAFGGRPEVRAMTEPRRYRVYLLRLWLAEGEGGRPVWRAALEDARTGERRGFADLARLCAFLEAITADGTEHDTQPPHKSL